MSQKKGGNSHGVVCLSPAMQLLPPPVLPVSVSASASDPVSLLTSAEKESEKHRKKGGREEGWERGGGVGRDGAEGWRDERREEKKLASQTISVRDSAACPL